MTSSNGNDEASPSGRPQPQRQFSATRVHVDFVGLEDEAETRLVSVLEHRSRSQLSPTGSIRSLRSERAMDALGSILLPDGGGTGGDASGGAPPAPRPPMLPPQDSGGGSNGNNETSKASPSVHKGHRRHRSTGSALRPNLADIAFRVRALNRAKSGESAMNVLSNIPTLETAAEIQQQQQHDESIFGGGGGRERSRTVDEGPVSHLGSVGGGSVSLGGGGRGGSRGNSNNIPPGAGVGIGVGGGTIPASDLPATMAEIVAGVGAHSTLSTADLPSTVSPSLVPSSLGGGGVEQQRSVASGGGGGPAASPFDEIGAAPIPQLHDQTSNTEQLFDHIQRVETLFQISEAQEEEDEPLQGEGLDLTLDGDGEDGAEAAEDDDAEAGYGDGDETLPLQGGVARSADTCTALLRRIKVLVFNLPIPVVGSIAKRKGYGSTGDLSKTASGAGGRGSKSTRAAAGAGGYRSIHAALTDILNLQVLIGMELEFLRTTVFQVMLPCLVAAFVLYYPLGNPELDFLPSDASLSWWLLFAVRQMLTLHLATTTEYVLVEALALRTAIYLKIFGPLLTLLVIQAKGWPFVVASWGLWDLLLIQASQKFKRNWLFFLGLGIFSDANPGGGILRSEQYFNALISLVIAGVATAMKRTYLALYLGKRTFIHYKPQLERLMVDMKLLAEVADLASEVEAPEFEKVLSLAEDYCRSPYPKKKTTVVGWDIKFQDDARAMQPEDDDDSSSDDVSEASDGSTDPGFLAESPTKDRADTPDNVDESEGENPPEPKIQTKWQKFKATDSFDSNAQNDLRGAPPAPHVPESPPRSPRSSFLRHRTTSNIKIKHLLDRWEEPINKSEKASDPSIHDILQFRKALSYMDDTHPFSLLFGPADTRDKCIKSSQRLYKKLLKYTPEASTLAFDVIGVLAYEVDGSMNEEKSKMLVRLFRPDRFDELSLLAFVQSCDGVYKKLRYFRASVGNSVLIDNVLEQIVNTIFYFILALVILSLMKFNPWTLLVSLSTLTVSFAFALGPSVAKYIEGIFLIAVRRPYDLGDRISICPADGMLNPDNSNQWFVEDITLYQTTLRYASTNEVSTVSNGSIATSRIFNGTRSPRATVNLSLLFKIDTPLEQIQSFRATIEQYIKDRPRTWVSLLHFRGAERVNLDLLFVEYTIKLQHRKSWQEAPAILASKADLTSFCYELGKTLDINYIPPATNVDVREMATKKILAHFSF